MNFSDAAIKNAYEVDLLDREPADRISIIAEDLGFSIEGVKAKLMQLSSTFRRDCGKEKVAEGEDPTLNFDEEQLRDVNRKIYDIAMGAVLPDGSPDHRTQLKAATYIRDDKKGRKEIMKAVQNAPTINLLQQFNTNVQSARELAESARRSLPAPITIESNKESVH